MLENSCKHNNVRKVVYAILDIPADMNTLDKTGIRKADVKLVDVEWTEIKHRWCADCGHVFVPPVTMHKAVQMALAHIPPERQNYIARVKAVRAILDCSLTYAKETTYELYEGVTREKPNMKYSKRTVEQQKQLKEMAEASHGDRHDS